MHSPAADMQGEGRVKEENAGFRVGGGGGGAVATASFSCRLHQATAARQLTVGIDATQQVLVQVHLVEAFKCLIPFGKKAPLCVPGIPAGKSEGVEASCRARTDAVATGRLAKAANTMGALVAQMCTACFMAALQQCWPASMGPDGSKHAGTVK